MAQVGFDNTFFARALSDYSNWKWSFAREAMQNCMDSRANNIDIYIDSSEIDNRVTIQFANDGQIMDQETMVNKLMNVGGTTKSGGDGNVGGFGVAKIVLYYSHHSYNIRSGNTEIEGNGGNYEIRSTEFLNGTRSIVLFDSDEADDLARQLYNQFIKFITYAQWDGIVTINYNGSQRVYKPNLKKGAFRREFNFGRLYTNKSNSNLLIFRVNGIPMFTKWIGFDGCAIFEATKSSVELMTSNRDGLKSQYQREIEDVIQRFQTNRSSVLNREPTMEIFGHDLIGVRGPDYELAIENTEGGIKALVISDDTPNNNIPTDNSDEIVNPEALEAPERHQRRERAPEAQEDVAAYEEQEERQEKPHSAPKPPLTHVGWSPRFMILNESGMVVPAHAMPGTMSSYSKKLFKAWTKIMSKLYTINNVGGVFGVGFCFGDAVAKCKVQDGITYYLINPFKIIEQDATASRSFAKRYNFTRQKEEIIMAAVHEFVHGAGGGNGVGLIWHDEDFANRQSVVSAVAMKNSSTLKKCFR